MFSVKSPKTNKVYYLHSKIVELRNGRNQQIYFFSLKSDGCLDKIPSGFEIIFYEKTGLPLLRKIK
jgi:hypothetical protein